MTSDTRTVEQKMYGTNWKTCSHCKLTGPDMVGDPPRCAVATTCEATKTRRGYGRQLIDLDLVNRFELDADDKNAIAKAVEKFTAERLREEEAIKALAQSAFRIAE